MTRKLIAGASTLALLAGYATVLPTAAAQFSDVPMSAWYFDYVNDLVDMGIVSGNPDGTFRPDNSLNRAEMAKIASNVAKKSGVITSEDASGAPAFRDIPAGEWFTAYVNLAAKNKLFEGYRDAAGNLTGFFGPGNLVNRAEASKVLLLAAGVPEMLTPGAPFMDVASTDWFYPYVTSAYNWSILDGYKTADGKLTGYFGPGDPVTRAQISKIAVLAQDPIDRYTGEHLTDMGSKSNTNGSNTNTNTGTGTNMNTNVPMSNVSFEAALSAASPATMTIATGTAFNTVAVYDFTAGKDEDVKITEMTILSRGFVSDSTVNGVLIVDGAGARHGNIVNFSSSKATISFASNPIIVKAGTTQQVKVQLNLASPAGFTSGTIGVELMKDSVKAWGATTGGLVAVKMAGSLAGAIHNLVTGANIGNVTFDDVQITAGAQEVDLGVKNKEVSKFKITQANSQEDVNLTELTVFNNGNSSDTDIENLKLVDQNGVVLATVKNTSNRYATFDLSAAPYTIPKGTSRNLSILVDVINGSTRTIQFVVSNDYDIKIKGASSQAFLLPSAGTSDTSFPIGDTAARNTLLIKEGVLTVSKATSSPSGEVSRGATEVVIGEFKVEAAGEDIEIQGGSINVATTSGNGAELKGTFKIVNGSGTTLHSVNAVDPAFDAMFDANTGIGADIVTRFNNFYTVKAGTTGTLKFVVDVADNATAGSTLRASLSNLNIKKLSSNRTGIAAQATPPAAAATGNVMSITAANVTVAKNASVGDTNIVLGATNQKIGSFNLTTTNAEGVSVSSLNLSLNRIDGITNLKLMADGQQLGSTRPTPGLTDNVFGTSGQLSIAKAASKTVDIYADVSSASAMTPLQAIVPINGMSGTGLQSANSVTAPAVAVALQNNPVVGSGTVSIAQYSSSIPSRVLSAGETSDLFSFEVRASNSEDMRLERAIVAFPVSSSSISTVELYDGATRVAGPLTISNGTVDFSGITTTIEKNKTKVFTVRGMLSSSSSFSSDRELVGALNYYEVVGISSGLRSSLRATNGVAFANAIIAQNTITYAATNTTVLKAGQLVYNTTTGTISRLTATGAATNAATGASAMPAIANGNVVKVLPTLFAGDTATVGQFAYDGTNRSFILADGPLAAGVSALPMLSTETVAAAANPIAGNYLVGDVVAYDTDVATPNNILFGTVTAVSATTVTITSDDAVPVTAVFVGAGAGGRITKLYSGAGTGNTHILENVRPVLAPQPTNFTPTASAEVGKFSVTANGSETLSLKNFVFSIAGSYNGTLGNFKIYQVQNGSETEILSTATLATDAGTIGYIDGADPKAQNVTVSMTNPFNVQPGTTATFILKADASAAKTAGTQGSVSLSLQLNGQSGARDTRNSVRYDYTNNTTTPTTFSNLDVANEYALTVGNIIIN